MRSFKNYSKQQETGNTNAETATPEDLAKQIASAYHGKSNADMLKGILLEAERSKRAGTLSNEEIESFYQNFAPMLDTVQRKKLRTIVEKLKQI